jgi:hypothetical protein
MAKTYRTALDSCGAARLDRVSRGGWHHGRGRAHCFSDEQYFLLRVDEGWMDLDSAKARTEGGGNGKDEGKRAKRAPGGLGLSRGELRRGPPG